MTRLQFRPVVLWIYLACWAVLLCSCGGGGGGNGDAGEARFVVATHGSAEFRSETFCPGQLDFSVFLEDGGIGWVSLEHEAFGSEIIEVTWARENGAYVVVAPEVLVEYDYDYDDGLYVDAGWKSLSLRVKDADRDGSAETGEASVTLICEWEQALSVDRDVALVSFDVAPETAPATVGFAEVSGLEPMYTFDDAIGVWASRALLADTLQGIELLVDGQSVAAAVTPLEQVGPLAKGFLIDPVEPVPFDAQLTIAAGTATDPFGVAVTFDGEVFHTLADPGPLTVNPSFDGEGGWNGLLTAAAQEDFPIVDGPRHAFIFRNLAGYFDVPDDASSFSIAVGVENAYEQCSYASSDVWLDTPTGRIGLYPQIPDDEACSDYPNGCLIPWTRRTVDLEGLRGQRVVLRASPGRYTTCRPDVYDFLHLDDIRIE